MKLINTSKNTKILSKSNIINAIIIIIASCGIGVLYNLLLPNSLPWIYKGKSIQIVSDSILFSNSPYKTIDNTFKGENSDKIINQKDPKQNKQSDKQGGIQNQNINQADNDVAVNENKAEIKTISYSQLVRVLNNPDFIIVDARRNEDYNKAHIPGSINIYALEDPDIRIPKMMSLPTSKTIIIYCDGGECDLSHELAKEFLEVLHYQKVFLYVGGWEEWAKKQGIK